MIPHSNSIRYFPHDYVLFAISLAFPPVIHIENVFDGSGVPTSQPNFALSAWCPFSVWKWITFRHSCLLIEEALVTEELLCPITDSKKNREQIKLP